MKNKILNLMFAFLIIAVLIWLGFYLTRNKSLPEENNLENGQVSQEEQNKPELFENYIRANIAELSPEPAVLGGTFYVTEVNFLSDDLALVDYEDGHIALKGIVGFNVINNEIVIESFEIVPEEDIYQGDAVYNDICIDQCGDGVCQEIVCMGEGCPCPETTQSCPADCA
jgi:hypothetical protein